MNDTPIYDKLKIEFQEAGKPRQSKDSPAPVRDYSDEEISQMDQHVVEQQADRDREALGDPDAEYDKAVDRENGVE